MYQIFGGNVKITHKNGERFQYLPKVNVYVTTLMPEAAAYRPKITDLQETRKTYRIRFRVVPMDSGESYETMTREYFALVIKREDGTLYIKRLQNTGDIREDKGGFFRKEDE